MLFLSSFPLACSQDWSPKRGGDAGSSDASTPDGDGGAAPDGSSGAGDSAVDTDGEVLADAGADACGTPPCSPCPDTDSDGVCDEVDNCLNVPNPTQHDPDGDKLGWRCDPLESLPAQVTASWRADTAVRTEFGRYATAIVAETATGGCALTEPTCERTTQVVVVNHDGQLYSTVENGPSRGIPNWYFGDNFTMVKWNRDDYQVGAELLDYPSGSETSPVKVTAIPDFTDPSDAFKLARGNPDGSWLVLDAFKRVELRARAAAPRTLLEGVEGAFLWGKTMLQAAKSDGESELYRYRNGALELVAGPSSDCTLSFDYGCCNQKDNTWRLFSIETGEYQVFPGAGCDRYDLGGIPWNGFWAGDKALWKPDAQKGTVRIAELAEPDRGKLQSAFQASSSTYAVQSGATANTLSRSYNGPLIPIANGLPTYLGINSPANNVETWPHLVGADQAVFVTARGLTHKDGAGIDLVHVTGSSVTTRRLDGWQLGRVAFLRFKETVYVTATVAGRTDVYRMRPANGAWSSENLTAPGPAIAPEGLIEGTDGALVAWQGKLYRGTADHFGEVTGSTVGANAGVLHPVTGPAQIRNAIAALNDREVFLVNQGTSWTVATAYEARLSGLSSASALRAFQDRQGRAWLIAGNSVYQDLRPIADIPSPMLIGSNEKVSHLASTQAVYEVVPEPLGGSAELKLVQSGKTTPAGNADAVWVANNSGGHLCSVTGCVDFPFTGPDYVPDLRPFGQRGLVLREQAGSYRVYREMPRP